MKNVDGDGDGVVGLRGSAPDVIADRANFVGNSASGGQGEDLAGKSALISRRSAVGGDRRSSRYRCRGGPPGA